MDVRKRDIVGVNGERNGGNEDKDNDRRNGGDRGGLHTVTKSKNESGDEISRVSSSANLSRPIENGDTGDEMVRVSSSSLSVSSKKMSSSKTTVPSSNILSSNSGETVRVSSALSHSAKPFQASTTSSFSPRLQPIPHPVIKPSSLGFLQQGQGGQDSFSVWRDSSIIVSPQSSCTGSSTVSTPASHPSASNNDPGNLASTLKATNMGLGGSVPRVSDASSGGISAVSTAVTNMDTSRRVSTAGARPLASSEVAPPKIGNNSV